VFRVRARFGLADAHNITHAGIQSALAVSIRFKVRLPSPLGVCFRQLLLLGLTGRQPGLRYVRMEAEARIWRHSIAVQAQERKPFQSFYERFCFFRNASRI
jgi:hypothetical protein